MARPKHCGAALPGSPTRARAPPCASSARGCNQRSLRAAKTPGGAACKRPHSRLPQHPYSCQLISAATQIWALDSIFSPLTSAQPPNASIPTLPSLSLLRAQPTPSKVPEMLSKPPPPQLSPSAVLPQLSFSLSPERLHQRPVVAQLAVHALQLLAELAQGQLLVQVRGGGGQLGNPVERQQRR